MRNIDEETELENNFLADVYYYMQENNCDKETAIKEVRKVYDTMKE